MPDPITTAALIGGGADILGGVLGGIGAGKQAQKQDELSRFNLAFQGRQNLFSRDLQRALFNAQQQGQGDINIGLQGLMQELRGNVGAGILSPEEQERQVGLQTQALQPSQNRLASTLAREFGLQNPSAQLALGREVLAGEQRIRAGIAEQQAQRRFQAQQQLNQLLASLQSQVGGTRGIGGTDPAAPQGTTRNAFGFLETA